MNQLKTTLLIFAVLLIGKTSLAQSGYVINDVDMFPGTTTTYFCDSILDINVGVDSVFGSADINAVIQGSNFQPSQLEATVYWGDGTSSTHTGAAIGVGQSIQFSPSLSHFYSSTGTYAVTVLIENLSNGTVGGDTLTVSHGYCYFDLYSFVEVDCDSNGTAEQTLNDNVPFILTSTTTGQTYTATLYSNQASFWGVPPGNYTYEIDPVWLANYGYNAYYQPWNQNIYVDSINNPLTTQVSLFCDSVNNNGYDDHCFEGMVYCDADSNGVYNPGTDTPVANAPVNIYPYTGNSQTVYTDPNGYFSTTYTQPSGTPDWAYVQVNMNWIQQNGYSLYYPQGMDTVFNTLCDSTLEMANLPVSCPTQNIDTGCVSGYVFCDNNSNGVLDSLETPLMGAPVTITYGQFTVTAYTDSFGYFNYCGISIPPGTPVIAEISSYWLSTHGYSTSGNNILTLLSNSNPSVNTVGFAIDCGSVNSCSDYWATINPWIGYFQNQTNYFQLEWGSYGPGILGGDYQLVLEFPAGLTPNTSSFTNQNYVINGNTITWTMNTIWAQFNMYDIISFDTPSGIPSGTQHNFTVHIVPINGGTDCCTSNNTSNLIQIVGNSYDPNDKLVDRSVVIDPNTTDTLTYTIRFQNTGTAPAQDIYIIDTISSKLDLSTFELITSSHSMNVEELGNNVLKFNFPQIWLPDSNANEHASHGYLTYRIAENASNMIGDEIENTAHIYFDWNPAIVTNTTYNINDESNSIENLSAGPEVMLYPNPTKGQVTVQAAQNINTIQVIGLNGQIIEQFNPKNSNVILDIAHYTSGVYIMKIHTEDGVSTQKLIKQ